MAIASLTLFLVAAALLVRGRRAPQTSRGMAHVAGYQQLGRPVAAGGEAAEPARRRGAATLEALGARLIGRLGATRVATLRSQLRSAGLYGVSAETFVGAQVALTGGGLLLSVWLAVTGGSLPLGVIFAVLAAYVGLAAPLAVVSRRARMRIAAIDRDMPELVDLLVVAVEAGLGLGAAMDRAGTRMRGPLAAELRLVLQEQGLGATSAEALEHLVARSDTPAVRSFVRTLVQGDQLGVPIGLTMRAIATDMRKRRRAAAEEQAQKAPIKILFPLVFCIFPSLLIVILAPAAISIVQELSGV